MEWMDHATNPLLWFTTKLADHLHCLGHRGTKNCRAGRRVNISFVWKEVVSLLLNICNLCSFNTQHNKDAPAWKAPSPPLAWVGGGRVGRVNNTQQDGHTRWDGPFGEGGIQVAKWRRKLTCIGRSLSRSTSVATFQSLTGLTKWHSERWRRFMQ